MFAAPNVAAPLPSSSAGGIGQVTVALLVVLAAVFVVAFLVRKMRGLTAGGSHGIEVLAQTSLGARERAVVIRVGETRLLLGVAPGRVNLLRELPAQPISTEPPVSPDGSPRPSFAQLLRKSLGR